MACVGATVGVSLAGLLAALVHGQGESLPWLVPTLGSSATLLFVVPASPMAQPWPIIAGTSLSALIGYAAGRWLGPGALVCGLAVGLAIGGMSLTRSLHPPAASAALAGVLGGSLVDSAGWWFPLAPVALDTVLLVAIGIVFHRLSGRTYPHRHFPRSATGEPPVGRGNVVDDEDLAHVLSRIGETFDIDRDDLRLLLGQLETEGLARRNG